VYKNLRCAAFLYYVSVFGYLDETLFHLAPVVQKVNSSIHWMNVHPLDNAIDFPNAYLLDIDYPLDGAIQPD